MDQTEVRQATSGATPNIEGIHAMNAVDAPPEQSAPANGSCPTCGSGSAAKAVSFVYALGRIEARFPQLSVEKEFAQALARPDAKVGQTDRAAMQSVLSSPENRYLARQLCWVLTVEGMETYLLVPRDPSDLQRLVDALRPAPSPLDLDVVIGARGPLAPPEMCNGLTVPIVVFDQIYSFDRDSLLKAIPVEKGSREKVAAAAAEVFDRIMLMADNAGATDDHRALNYLAVRYPAIYHAASEMYSRNASLTALEVRSSALSSTRNVKDVIFCYTDRGSGVVEKQFCRVDVTEEFPFLVTKMSSYYDRS